MNNKKTSNHVRLIAFFLTATTLICTFGLTVDGWQTLNNEANGDPDLKDELANDSLPDIPNDPEFINPLTGLPTSETVASSSPFGFVLDGSEQCYGMSMSDILIEIPIESGKTRYLSIMNDVSELWKVGSITYTRGYINNLLKCFGALAVYSGTDDVISYDSCDITNNAIDLSLEKNYHYNENSGGIFTNYNLISIGLNDYGIDYKAKEDAEPPLTFSDSRLQYEGKAINVTAVLSESSCIKLKYNAESGKYQYIKNGNAIVDQMNTKSLEFTNCFILFANSVIYDRTTGQHLVVDTAGSGEGFYMSNGSFTPIKWSLNLSGNICFYLTNGERLIANKGNSYVGFIRSSYATNLIIN